MLQNITRDTIELQITILVDVESLNNEGWSVQEAETCLTNLENLHWKQISTRGIINKPKILVLILFYD
jgi:hypothetical protein